MHNPFCFCFLSFFLLLASAFCHGTDLTTVEVVGVGECADCHKNNIKTNHAFSGLSVSIDCKQKDGNIERKGVAKLDEEGKFKVLLPTEVLKDGKLKGKCFAQLHSASSTPCPSHDGLEMANSMIVFKSKGEGKQTFGLPSGLKFKSETCVSAFFWHHYYHHPPLPPISLPVFPPHPPLYSHPYLFPPYHHKLFPPKVYTPPPTPEVPLPPPVPKKPPPDYEKPPPVYEKPPPVYEKPPPVYVKPVPPPVPVYKVKPPKPPVYKPKPPVSKPPAPEKPESPPSPVYYKHPWYKILPPISKLPPCPPVPKVIPVVPPKYSHPKFGKKFPPLSPSVPHP
ncbi:proline-rich protein 4-like [Benincasa hispida]|uniref:proline-rich protein 4-like n=1 Tax=Benincasa hispida TaxID=102211 RepID=UPI0019018786|nr:proline-rich protein 4-like [Benincasa hispida]